MATMAFNLDTTISIPVLQTLLFLSSFVLTRSTGFAVVGEYEDPKIQEAQRSAFDQMVGWLKSH